jgi:hypothetical protein
VEFRGQPSTKKATGLTPETPAQAGTLGKLRRALRWPSLRHPVVKIVDDRPDHLRADIGLPPRSATAEWRRPIHPRIRGRDANALAPVR